MKKAHDIKAVAKEGQPFHFAALSPGHVVIAVKLDAVTDRRLREKPRTAVAFPAYRASPVASGKSRV